MSYNEAIVIVRVLFKFLWSKVPFFLLKILRPHLLYFYFRNWLELQT